MFRRLDSCNVISIRLPGTALRQTFPDSLEDCLGPLTMVSYEYERGKAAIPA